MKAFLDTSVLVPVFYGDHVHHAASMEVFTGWKIFSPGIYGIMNNWDRR